MPEITSSPNYVKRDGRHIIELLCQADHLLRNELREIFSNGHQFDFQFLLEAQLNISKAIEALYDRASDGQNLA
jgi:hypothetical protein